MHDSDKLCAAIAQRTAAHAQWRQATAAATRGQLFAAEAERGFSIVEERIAAVRAQRAKRLATQIVAGETGDIVAAGECDDQMIAAHLHLSDASAAAKQLRDAESAALAIAQAAQAGVEHAARELIDAERNALAREFTDALDHAIALGHQLRGLSHTGLLAVPVSPEVTEALARLPQPNFLNMPVAILQGGGVDGNYAVRLAELTHDPDGAIPKRAQVETIHAVRIIRGAVAA